MNKEYIDELIENLAVLQEQDIYISDLFFTRNEDSPEPDFPFFHKIYPLTNEYLSSYFSKLNLKDKKILTVGSSGDQVLYSLCFGAKDITHIDINPYAKFYLDLKIASYQNFDYNDFIKMFHYRLCASNIIKSKLYRKISHSLPEDSKYFWDNIFIEFDKLSNFTHGTSGVYDHYVYSEEQFNAIKTALNKPFNYQFVCLDILNILPLVKNKKYDAIFLSNIYDYIDEWKHLQSQKNNDESLRFYSAQQIEFFKICKGLLNSLNPNGILQVQYGFNYMQTNASTYVFAELFKDYKVYNIPTREGGPVIIQNRPRESTTETVSTKQENNEQ